jgi:CheY-like chemotaxis protein
MTAPRVLVVDDRPESRKLLALRLAHEGYTVEQADSGEAALARVAAQAPDLVLLDVVMPGMDGFEVCRRMREMPAMRGVPVVMVTSLEGTEDCVRGLEAGADDFILKPFRPAELQARVRSLLRVKSLFDAGQRQQAALAEWSALLEQRVAEGVVEVERLSRLKRFFSPRLAARLVTEPGDTAWRSHRGEVTVLFADLRGFSAFAESAPAERVMALLAEFHAAMGRLIFDAEGTLERFTGDGMMVFFNDPDPVPDHSAHAVRLGLAMQAEATRLAVGWRREAGPQGLAIGIARGMATLGALGFEGRLDYAAIGSVTNLASRLCAEAGSGEVWVSQAVQTEIAGRFELRALPRQLLKASRSRWRRGRFCGRRRPQRPRQPRSGLESPLVGQRPQHAPALVVAPQVAALHQVAEQLGDHGARTADLLAEFFLRDGHRHPARAVGLQHGFLSQQLHETAVGVVQRQVAGAVGEPARQADDARHELEADRRVGGDALLQRLPGDDAAHGGRLDDDAGRARAAVQAHLAHVFAGAVVAEGELLPVGARRVGAQTATADEVQRSAGLAFLDQQRAAAVAALGTALCHAAQGGGQEREAVGVCGQWAVVVGHGVGDGILGAQTSRRRRRLRRLPRMPAACMPRHPPPPAACVRCTAGGCFHACFSRAARQRWSSRHVHKKGCGATSARRLAWPGWCRPSRWKAWPRSSTARCCSSTRRGGRWPRPTIRSCAACAPSPSASSLSARPGTHAPRSGTGR